MDCHYLLFGNFLGNTPIEHLKFFPKKRILFWFNSINRYCEILTITKAIVFRTPALSSRRISTIGSRIRPSTLLSSTNLNFISALRSCLWLSMQSRESSEKSNKNMRKLCFDPFVPTSHTLIIALETFTLRAKISIHLFYFCELRQYHHCDNFKI